MKPSFSRKMIAPNDKKTAREGRIVLFSLKMAEDRQTPYRADHTAVLRILSLPDTLEKIQLYLSAGRG